MVEGGGGGGDGGRHEQRKEKKKRFREFCVVRRTKGVKRTERERERKKPQTITEKELRGSGLGSCSENPTRLHVPPATAPADFTY